MKKFFSASIFAFLSFLAFPLIAFASDGTFTASNYSFDPITHILSFTASNFNPPRPSDIGGINDFSIANYNSSGNFVLDYYNYSLNPSAPVLPGLTTDFNSSVTYNYYWHADLPTNSDPVYLRVSQGSPGPYRSQPIPANQLLTSTSPTPTPPQTGTDGTFTASNYSFDPITHTLTFTATNFNPPRPSDIVGINNFSIPNNISI